jgi:hypothetical protein
MSHIPSIEKEKIAGVHFVSYDVLDKSEHKHHRKAELEKAMILGNSLHTKAMIVFITEDGPREVETTVWATTDDSVTLKGGVVIPIHCIEKVSFV